MRDDTREALIPLALLSAASGARTFAGVAAISPGPARVLAAGELIYDKVPTVPKRTEPALLLGRVVAGAVVGMVVGRRTGSDRGTSAAIGGLIALASTYATYRMRRALSMRLSAVAAALVEDAIVVGTAAVGAALLSNVERGSPGRSSDDRGNGRPAA